MLFNSYTFLVFLAITAALFNACPVWPQRKLVLLFASYVFYAAWKPPYALLLFSCTALDWSLARMIARCASRARGRLLLCVSLAFNFGLLGYFKYGNFLEANFAEMGSMLGLSWHAGKGDILLPIGISFYTFASLSYTIDVYRREIGSDTTFADYALFVSFFPHLVAGPIVRASVLLPQIARPRMPDKNQVGWGLALFCIGLFCKTVLADAILNPVSEAVFAHPGSSSAPSVWAGVLAFSGQIYYDFSGYSLCAIGLAMIFGFSFPDNFRYPYGALSFSEFWRRWHISLSTWLRDYLYIPLGGNRSGRGRTVVALMLTMLLGGLWHGASWMFVLWGALHGTYLVVERLGGASLMPNARSGQLRALVIFLLVSLTWIPFRSGSEEQAWMILRGLFCSFHAGSLAPSEIWALLLVAATARWHFVMRNRSLEQVFTAMRARTKAACLTSLLVAMYLCSGGSSSAFIYFQF